MSQLAIWTFTRSMMSPCPDDYDRLRGPLGWQRSSAHRASADGSQFDISTEKQQFLFFFISSARWNHDISSAFFMIFIPNSVALPTG